MSAVHEASRYTSALGHAGSGAAELARASGTLAVLATKDGISLGRVGVRQLRNTPALRVARTAQHPKQTASTVRNRVLIGGAVVGALAAGAVLFRILRHRNDVPEPAPAPPSVRPATDGAGPKDAAPPTAEIAPGT